jgi:hypothetical protein
MLVPSKNLLIQIRITNRSNPLLLCIRISLSFSLSPAAYYTSNILPGPTQKPTKYLKMRYQTAAGAAIALGFTFLQSCPAPVWAVVPAIAGIIAQSLEIVVDSIGKRSIDGDEFDFSVEAIIHPEVLLERRGGYCMPVPKGVPENVIGNCCKALRSARIKITGKNPQSGEFLSLQA